MLAECLPATPETAPPFSLGRTSLFFDFDGTLVDLSATPDGVVIEAGLLDSLDALAELLPGRVAIVSGRSIAQLDAMLGDHARLFAVAGSHGAERRTPEDGHVTPEAPFALKQAAKELAAFAAERDLVFEPKSLGAALHYRARPEQEADAVQFVEQLAQTHALTLQRGKMMVEVRGPGDKGAALTALMAAPTMVGTLPLFFGDDVTDEDGFEAAAALGGAGVLIGDARPTAATYRLGDVDALRDWIAAILET
jgi:trehalose 6-phosphate phosphatase